MGRRGVGGGGEWEGGVWGAVVSGEEGCGGSGEWGGGVWGQW